MTHGVCVYGGGASQFQQLLGGKHNTRIKALYRCCQYNTETLLEHFILYPRQPAMENVKHMQHLSEMSFCRPLMHTGVFCVLYCVLKKQQTAVSGQRWSVSAVAVTFIFHLLPHPAQCLRNIVRR